LKQALRSSTTLLIACILLAGQTRNLRLEPIDPAARQTFDKQVKVALVVGVSAYPKGSGISQLKYAARDADVLGDALKSQGYLVRILRDSHATGPLIRRTLRELSDAVLSFALASATFCPLHEAGPFRVRPAFFCPPCSPPVAPVGSTADHLQRSA
jgi:hypothetical protein